MSVLVAISDGTQVEEGTACSHHLTPKVPRDDDVQDEPIFRAAEAPLGPRANLGVPRVIGLGIRLANWGSAR